MAEKQSRTRTEFPVGIGGEGRDFEKEDHGVLFYRPTQGSNSMDHGKMADEELGSLTIEITTFSRRSVFAT